MAGQSLIFHPAATADARKVASKYGAISAKLAARFWKELDEAIEGIASHPARHHFDGSGMRRSNLRKFPYHLLFEELLDGIHIIVIRHNRRNPGYGLKRR